MAENKGTDARLGTVHRPRVGAIIVGTAVASIPFAVVTRSLEPFLAQLGTLLQIAGVGAVAWEIYLFEVSFDPDRRMSVRTRRRWRHVGRWLKALFGIPTSADLQANESTFVVTGGDATATDERRISAWTQSPPEDPEARHARHEDMLQDVDRQLRDERQERANAMKQERQERKQQVDAMRNELIAQTQAVEQRFEEASKSTTPIRWTGVAVVGLGIALSAWNGVTAHGIRAMLRWAAAVPTDFVIPAALGIAIFVRLRLEGRTSS